MLSWLKLANGGDWYTIHNLSYEQPVGLQALEGQKGQDQSLTTNSRHLEGGSGWMVVNARAVAPMASQQISSRGEVSSLETTVSIQHVGTISSNYANTDFICLVTIEIQICIYVQFIITLISFEDLLKVPPLISLISR